MLHTYKKGYYINKTIKSKYRDHIFVSKQTTRKHELSDIKFCFQELVMTIW